MSNNKALTIPPRLAALLFLTLLMGGCASTAGQWERVVATNTIPAYEEFLGARGDSQYAVEARQRLEVLYVERDWAAAHQADDINAYEVFLRERGESQYAAEARQRLEVLCAERDWPAARQIDNINAYEVFLRERGKSRYAAEVRQRLEVLYAERDWEADRAEFLRMHMVAAGTVVGRGDRIDGLSFAPEATWRRLKILHSDQYAGIVYNIVDPPVFRGVNDVEYALARGVEDLTPEEQREAGITRDGKGRFFLRTKLRTADGETAPYTVPLEGRALIITLQRLEEARRDERLKDFITLASEQPILLDPTRRTIRQLLGYLERLGVIYTDHGLVELTEETLRGLIDGSRGRIVPVSLARYDAKTGKLIYRLHVRDLRVGEGADGRTTSGHIRFGVAYEAYEEVHGHSLLDEMTQDLFAVNTGDGVEYLRLEEVESRKADGTTDFAFSRVSASNKRIFSVPAPKNAAREEIFYDNLGQARIPVGLPKNIRAEREAYEEGRLYRGADGKLIIRETAIEDASKIVSRATEEGDLFGPVYVTRGESRVEPRDKSAAIRTILSRDFADLVGKEFQALDPRATPPPLPGYALEMSGDFDVMMRGAPALDPQDSAFHEGNAAFFHQKLGELATVGLQLTSASFQETLKRIFMEVPVGAAGLEQATTRLQAIETHNRHELFQIKFYAAYVDGNHELALAMEHLERLQAGAKQGDIGSTSEVIDKLRGYADRVGALVYRPGIGPRDVAVRKATWKAIEKLANEVEAAVRK